MSYQDLRRTPTSTGNKKVFTYSCWIKRNGVSAWARLLSIMDGSTDAIIQLTNVDKLRFRDEVTGPDIDYISSRPLRDAGSWMHVLVAIDTTAIQAEHRIRMYINGDSLIEHGLDTESMPGDRNLDHQFNDAGLEHRFFARNNDSEYFLGEAFDLFWVDGQALTPDVFGFNKDGDGYVSVGSTQATDFRPGQWVPKSPRTIKSEINRRGGFGVNGFYLPMNDSSNFGADFHTTPNSIIKLKGEDLPQPRNGAPTTSDAYVSQLRTDPYAANLVLAVPGISNATGANLVTNGTFDTNTTGWTSQDATLSVDNGRIKVLTTNTNYGSALQTVTGLTVGQRYTFQVDMYHGNASLVTAISGASPSINSGWQSADYVWRTSFTATTTSLVIDFQMASQSNVYGFWDNVILKAEDAPRDYSADIKGSGTNRTPTVTGPAGVGYEIPSYYGSAIHTTSATDALYYDVDGSGSNAYGTGDFTFECWFYATEEPSNWGILMKHATNGSWNNGITLTSKNNTSRQFVIYTQDGSSNVQTVGTTTWALNQWHHVVAERYNGQITLYVNGVAEATRADTRNYAVAGTPASSAQYALSIGAQSDGNYQSTGYIQDVRVYKGVAKYKGGFDVSKPYTPVGFEGQSWRQVPDNCKNNFATWNPLLGPQGCALADGNLTVTSDGANSHKGTRSTMGMSSGKWYWEYRVGTVAVNSYVGVSQDMTPDGLSGANYIVSGQGGNNYVSPNGSFSVTDSSMTTGMIIGCAFDRDASTQQLKVYKNGSLAVTGTSSDLGDGVIYLAHNSFNAAVSDGWEANFGQNPTFSGTTTAGTYTDSNGKGLFKYQPPAGYLALCEDNLPTPDIADPGKHFKTVIYTGTGSSRAVTGVGFKPDFVWIKERNSTSSHELFNSVVGPTLKLNSNATNVESANTGALRSFDSDGFSLGSGGAVNEDSTKTYVAWCWKAGGAAVTNTDGSITSQVSANQTAGFSIVSYTGTGSAGTVGHGLGKAPSLIITKHRAGTSAGNVNWNVSTSVVPDGYLELNTTTTHNSNADRYVTAGTNTNSFPGGYVHFNDSNRTYISYCWAEIPGYSKIGSYRGSGNADGPFVYCGFKPAWVMVKRTTSGASEPWAIYDSSRRSINPNSKGLYANDSAVENDASGRYKDFLSNGFKVRGTSGEQNSNGATYVFMAFAESPFQTANAK